jgi:hypothetical protein
MKQFDEKTVPYSKVLETYLINNTVFTPINISIVYTCGICGKPNLIDMTAHIQRHNFNVPEANNYFLSLPYEKVNQLIRNGKQFIKVLTFGEFAVQTEVTDYNALNFKNGQKLVDCDNVRVKWSATSNQFKKVFWESYF